MLVLMPWRYRNLNEEQDGWRLYRDIYPFDSVPRFIVHSEEVRRSLERIHITDTTLRDGQQGWRPFTIEECEKIYEFLVELGGRGAITSTEAFLYTEKDRQTVKRLTDYGYRHPKVIGWIRASLSDLQLVLDAKLDETVVLMSISDYHIRYKLGLSKSDALSKYLEVAEKALSHGIIIRASLEDVTRADIDGTVVPFLNRLLELSEKHKVPVKIKLPDTLGVGLPFVEAPPPRGIPAIITAIRMATGIPPEHIEFHGHNDLGLAVANHLAAWMYGAAGSNCTLLGIGERAGNCPLEVMAVHYAGIKGASDINLKALSQLPELFNKMGLYIMDHYPIVGRNAFRTKAGIHADGLLKNPEVYLPFDPLKVLGLPYSIAVTPYSGRAAIVLWIRNYLGVNGITKEDPRVANLYNEIVELFERTGRVEPLSDQEMLAMVRKHFPDLFNK